ncbi:hypothetical protein J6590_031745 [Homalodisca vitripennis]|nr:hypothetical protein J6590_031745 [Homalodisca vitripennis]
MLQVAQISERNGRELQQYRNNATAHLDINCHQSQRTSASLSASFLIASQNLLSLLCSTVVFRGVEYIEFYPRRVPFWLVYTFQLNLHWAQQRPTCHLNLGNFIDVQKRHITNCKCRDSGAQRQLDRSIKDSCQPRHKVVSPTACCDWRGWFRAGFSSFPGDMTDINALNFSSWISTGGGPYPQPYPSRISCLSGNSA